MRPAICAYIVGARKGSSNEEAAVSAQTPRSGRDRSAER
jgi:hypothetical protein